MDLVTTLPSAGDIVHSLPVQQGLEGSPTSSRSDKTLNLPSEVLRHIFVAHQRLGWPATPSGGTPAHLDTELVAIYCYDWLSIMKVCRRWYFESAECATLWSSISISGTCSYRFLRLSLERSKQARLRLDLHEWLEGQLGVPQLELLVAHAHRLDELNMRLMRSTSLVLLSPLLEAATPTLQRLSLAVSQTGSPWAAQQDAQLLLSFPLLRQLTIMRFLIPWSYIGSNPSLVSLEVDAGSVLKPTLLRDIVETLRNYSRLRTLNVQDLFLSDPDSRVSAVQMPHLRTCRVVGDHASCAGLLRHLHTPSTMQVSVVCRSDIRTLTAFQALSPIWTKLSGATTIDNMPSPRIVSLALSVQYLVDLHGWTVRIPTGTGWESSGADYYLKFRCSFAWMGSPASLVAELPVADVRVLCLKAYPENANVGPADDFLLTLCARMPQVDDLRICVKNEASIFLPVQHIPPLSLFGSPIRTPSQAEVLCPWPTLKTLTIYNVEFTDIIVAQIHETIQSRSRHGCSPLSHLVLAHCKVSDEHRSLLRECAEDVIVSSAAKVSPTEYAFLL